MKTTLIKTAVKGLYLTTNGKAYRKDLKIEIKATTNGKVRFNGKLYDLQKLIDWSGKNATKNKGNPLLIRELKKQGFKKTQISGLYVSKSGFCCNSVSKRNITVRNGKASVNGKAYNVSKLVLETFYKIPVRSGQIIFINGNDKDFSFENLQYKTTIKPPLPVETDLIKCVRFYFEVDKNLNKKSFLIKFYLSEIIKKRGFNLKYKGLDFDLFLYYFKTEFLYLSENQKAVFQKFNYSATNGKNAINKYLNLLICDCMQDFENGLLEIKNFTPKPKTKTEINKQFNDKMKKQGLNIKIPLRKPSLKESISKYKKLSNEIAKHK